MEPGSVSVSPRTVPGGTRAGAGRPLNIVRIEGAAAALAAVVAMPQVTVFSGEDLEAGRGSLSAYVETADIPTIEGLGTTVTVLMDDGEHDALLAELETQFDDEKPRLA